MIKFNQNPWVKPYFDINTDLRKKAKNDFEKGFLSWWIMQFFEKKRKMWANIEILNSSQKKNYKTIWCRKQIIILQSVSHRNEKKEVLINKPTHLGLSILELSKILTHEFWHDYVKLKYGEKAKLCYIDTDITDISLCKKKQIIFITTLQKILKIDLILQMMN